MDDEAIAHGVADYVANPTQPVAPRLRDSLYLGVQQKPDYVAEMRRVSQATGVDYLSAQANEPQLKAQAQVEMIDPNGLIRTAPKTANWLAEPDNAAVAHDDTPILQRVEQLFKNLGNIGKASADVFGEMPYDAAQALNEFIDPFGDMGLAQRRALDPRTGQFTATGPQTYVQQQAAKLRAAGNATMPTAGDWMGAGVNSGIASLLQNAPSVGLGLLTRNPELALSVMAGQQGLQSYGEGRDAGMQPAAAAIHGAEQGYIEGITEKLPMEHLLKDLKVGSGFASTWFHQLLTDVPGELAATTMQNFNDWRDLHPNTSIMDYLTQLPADLGTTVIATAFGVTGHTAMEQTVHAVAKHLDGAAPQADVAKRSQEQNAQLGELMKAAQASALRQRDPQTFHDYVDAVSQDTPVDRVYINAHDLVDVLAQGDPKKLEENAQVLHAMPSVMPQLEDALKSGGLVEIPTSELLAFTPETSLGQSLMDHLKVDPEGYSPKEADEFLQSQAESLRADVAKVVKDQGQADEFQASAERVHAQLKAQLDQVARYTPDVNDVLAMLPTRFYATMAAQLGVTPEQFAEQHQLRTQAQGVLDGALTQYAGEGARTADAASLEEAKRLTSAAIPAPMVRRYGSEEAARQAVAHAVYRNLGWFQGDDGRWRFEISDQHAAIKPDALDKMREANMRGEPNIKLGDMLDHEPLYAAYPELRDTKARIVPEGYGGIPGLTGAIAHSKATGEPVVLLGEHMLSRGEREPKRALLHEVQHLIQANEGFAKGASFEPETLRRNGYGAALDAEVAANGGDEAKAGETIYQRSAGELEARDVESRMVYTDEARKLALPRALRNMGDQPVVVFHSDGQPDAVPAPVALHQEGRFWQGYEPGLGFQSTLYGTVLSAKQAKASADQWLSMIQNTPGVKKEEVEWIGLPEGLKAMEAANKAEGAGPVTREQVMAFVAQNGVRLKEVVQGGEDPAQFYNVYEPDYEQEYDDDGEPIEGSETYGPWTVGDNRQNGSIVAEFDSEEEAQDWIDSQRPETDYEDYQAIKGGENYREVLLILPNAPRPFRASMGHWDHDNVVAHTRLADFTTPDGKRALGVLEIQSDWHQKGRDQGYAKPASREEQDAAADAWDKARAARNEIGLAWAAQVRDAIPELVAGLERKLAEVNAYTRGLTKQREDMAAQYFGPNELIQWRPDQREQSEQWDAMKRDLYANDQLAGRYAQLVEGLRAQMARFDEAGATHADARLRVADLVMSAREYWSDVDEDPALKNLRAELRDARQPLADANLRAREAEQTVNRLAGQDGIPDAPFKATWPALAMKRIIREAVEKGYDKIIWATGEQQADLYDMRQQVGNVGVMRNEFDPNTVRLGLENRRAEDTIREHLGNADMAATREQLHELFGAALGERIWTRGQENDPSFGWSMVDGEDFAIGGEGHKAFYNRNLVNITNDIIKKFGAKVGVHEIETGTDQGWVSGGEVLRAQGVPEDQISERWASMTPEQRDQAMTDHRAGGTSKQWGFDITDKMREEDKAVHPPLFQADKAEQPRGSYNPTTNTITLLRNADLSTYLHELGHFFLETTARVAASENAPAQLKDDWGKAANFMGFGGIDPAAWLALPIDARREGHEKWARGFEAYLREGRAPTPQLKGPFQRFKAWLIHVYQDARQLNVELTDEVRGVFDRLLATQDEIAQAQASRGFLPIFETKPEGMTDLAWEAYQRLGQEATADAEDELGARSIRDMRWLQNARSRMIRQLSREAVEKRKALRAEVQGEVQAEPVYAAQQFLKRGLVNGEAAEGPTKLSLADLRTMYGEAPTSMEEATGQKKLEVDYRRLGYGKYGMLAEEGLHPDQVAELFGFSSGDHLVRSLLDAEPMNAKIEGITDQRMLERYGDLTDPQAIAKAADEAIHNDARLRFVATEANALAKAAGKPKVLAEAARDFAREMVSSMKVRDLRPGKFTGAEQRAARAAAKAAAKGDLALAAMEKRNQLINAQAAKAAYAAQEEVDKALRMFARLQGAGAQKSIDPSYRAQIDQLLERFDLRTGQSLKAIDKRASLVKWVEQLKANDLEPAIPDELLNEAYRKHYRDMTVDELRGLVDTVRTIAHLGQLKNKLLAARNARDFATTVAALTDEVAASAIGKPRDKLESNQALDHLDRGVRNFFVSHRKFDSLINRLAGFKEGSTLWNVLVRPKNTATDREASMLDASNRRLAEIIRPIAADKFRAKVYIPEIGNSLSLEGRLAILLNWGNETNRQRVLDGHRWTPAQVEAVLATLEPRHFEFAQNLLDHINSYRPLIEAKEMRVYGVVPPMEEAYPFTARAADGSQVDMRGGYYPISYDPDKSAKAADFDAIRMAKQAVIGAVRGYSKPGHLKARVDEVTGRPIKLRLSVAFQHLNDVIHDLSWHEYLIDARRLLGNDTLANAIRVHAGPEVLRELKSAVDAMEVGDVPAQNAFEGGVNYLRSGATTAGLAWNFLTALQQPIGILNGTARIGPKWMAVGLKRMAGDAATMQNSVDWVRNKSEFMRLRADGTTLSREIKDVRGGLKHHFANDALKAIMPGEAAVKVAKGMDAVEASFYHFIGIMQLVADVPTWIGQYEKSMSHQGDEDYAIRMADQAVRDAQGSGHIGDLSAIQRGGPLAKLWTNFYSYFNVVYNQLAESVEETQLKGVSNVPALASDVMLILVLPSVIGNLIKKAATGDDWQDWPADLAKGLLSDCFGLMVGLRDIGGAVLDGKSNPAGLRFLETSAKLAMKVKAGKTSDEAFFKTVNTEAGILFHYPAAQVQRTVLGLQALADGTTHNPLSILAGPPPKKRAS